MPRWTSRRSMTSCWSEAQHVFPRSRNCCRISLTDEISTNPSTLTRPSLMEPVCIFNLFSTLHCENSFHHSTHSTYLYNGCLLWYHVVLTSRVHSSVKYSQASTVTAVDSFNSGISVLNHCLSWSKFVNTHLFHCRQWFNIHFSFTNAVPFT